MRDMRRAAMGLGVALFAAVAWAADPAASAQETALIDPAKPLGGWTFDNGREFPGATGDLTIEAQGGRNGTPALVLKGDFTKGGNYVQASRMANDVPLRSLGFWVKHPGADSIGLRLVDAGGTCHQVRLKLKTQDGWQRVQFPAAEFFAGMGESKAGGMVLKYETWGSAKDKSWSGKLRSLHVLMGKQTGIASTLALCEVDAQAGAAPSTEAAVTVAQTIALDEVLQAGEIDWSFDNGREFRGAKGGLTLLKDQPEPGQNALRLAGDFSGGGAYVQATRSLTDLGDRRLESLVLRMRSSNCPRFNVRLIDGTGQCHQHKGLTFTADGQWHDVAIKPSQVAGGEHWSGANDGKWHGAAKLVAILIGKGTDAQPVIDFGGVRAEVSASAQVAPASWREGFESADGLRTWQTAGAVTIAAEQPFAGKSLLHVARSLDAINQPAHAVGPSFPIRDGAWVITGAGRSALYSPDSSYQGVVAVELLDGAGKALGRKVVLELRGTNVWQPFRTQLDTPAGAVAGRIKVELEKTYGTLGVDELAAAFEETAGGDEKLIERVMAAPARLGGLFFPDEPPAYKLSVWSAKPLRPEEMTVTATVSDYWGAEQGPGRKVALVRTGFKDQAFQYEGELKLDEPALAVGRFYRLHVDVPVRGGKSFRHTIGAAKLPEAATRKLPPESVPFTIRNWDNRIKDYFFLTDRIGIRLPGIWGGWDNKPPYKAHAPGIGFCSELGMKWVTGTPGANVERGVAAWTDPAMLRAGMSNFLAAYATNGLAYICLGNEPHGGPSQVSSNVAAYKAIYEAVKAFDPNIRVIATSVEPNEEYFRQGYQNYCDIYDFHTYESYPGIRKTVAAYQALMRKYKAEKPIFSTELGLNCQGLSRLVVAQEVVKKLAVFFAAGGANASWFTIMYPDSKGTEANSSGQAFNVFDCRYNLFNPKLDAVTLYHTVNGIADKPFRAEKVYADGTEVYLFANAAGECLQIAWNEKARLDVGLPLPGVEGAASVTMLDGMTLALQPDNGVVTVTVSTDPVMVRYRASKPSLADALAPAGLALAGPAPSIIKGQRRDVELRGAGLSPDAVAVTAPSGWTVASRGSAAGVVTCQATAPSATDAQMGRLVATRPGAAVVVDLPVVSSFGAELRPLPAGAAGPAAVEVRLSNHDREKVALHWKVTIDGEFAMEKGSYRLTDPARPQAGFGEAADGVVELTPDQAQSIRLPLRDVAPLTLERLSLRVSDDLGRESTVARFMAGFVAVPRGTPAVDGDLTDACWAAAPAQAVGEERQFFPLHKEAKWRGADDCSATIRYLWDEANLYLGVHVTDDVFVGTREDGSLWNQDGLQILVDPRRDGGEKMGYYDCSLGLGTKGAQMWCHSTASPDVLTGEVKEAKVVVRRGAGGSADYEVAIPWTRLAPFKPRPGADLGLSMIVNDDDGQGRNFMAWFSGAHLKETDMVADLVLTE